MCSSLWLELWLFIGGLFWATLTLLAGFSGQLWLYWRALLDHFDFIGGLFWTTLTLLAGFSRQFDFICGLFWTTLTLLAGFSRQLWLFWRTFLDNFDFICGLFWTTLTLLAGFSGQLWLFWRAFLHNFDISVVPRSWSAAHSFRLWSVVCSYSYISGFFKKFYYVL